MVIVSKIIIPLITLIVIIYALYKKVDIYQEFLNGVKEGLSISLNIFPSVFAMIVAVTVLVKSNIITDLSNLITIGSLFSGLLTGSGLGILLLFKTNKNLKENISILSIIYLVGVIVGILVDLLV